MIDVIVACWWVFVFNLGWCCLLIDWLIDWGLLTYEYIWLIDWLIDWLIVDVDCQLIVDCFLIVDWSRIVDILMFVDWLLIDCWLIFGWSSPGSPVLLPQSLRAVPPGHSHVGGGPKKKRSVEAWPSGCWASKRIKMKNDFNLQYIWSFKVNTC